MKVLARASDEKNLNAIPAVGLSPELHALQEDRVASEQIDALFGAITVGVCGAAIAAAILAGTLYHLGALEAFRGIAWASFITLCAASHIFLVRSYRSAQPVGNRWRVWAYWFTLISFAEGVGWGWAPMGLVTAVHANVQHLVFLIVGGVSAATLPGFSPYLPAFFAIFLPATFMTEIASFSSDDPVSRASFPILLVFIGAMVPLGIKANRSFKQLVRLRIQTEELAKDLERQKDIAVQANLAKSSFLAAASHDLRQPVHALGLFVGALHSVALPKEGRRLLEKIEASAQAMDGLFSALLDISRLDAGVVEVHRQPFVIAPILERICHEHAEEARTKAVHLIGKPCTAAIDSDPVLVERILRNLVSNAVRYTERGRILVGCRRRGSMLAIQVWDTGIGIPADQQERIFQEYYQLSNPERDRTKGLGLGLAIVRRLTNLLDCDLSLRSEPGRGSCFEIVLPLADNVTRVSQPPADTLSGSLAQGFIIVIDDELAIREAMTSLLTAWGHNVATASSGDDAIERLSTYPMRPDLIICDYRLREGENGITVIDRLRSDYNEAIPAMLITGDTAPDRLAESQASGLLLLHKPVSNSKLRAAIVHLIATARQDTLGELDLDIR